eukprot:6200065-Amphidinium_carterae.1
MSEDLNITDALQATWQIAKAALSFSKKIPMRKWSHKGPRRPHKVGVRKQIQPPSSNGLACCPSTA